MLEEGDAHGTISTCVLVASYDEEKSTEISPDVTMVSTAPGAVLTVVQHAICAFHAEYMRTHIMIFSNDQPAISELE